MSARLCSVVIPVHNGAPWVGEAIESVQRQSVDAWELIIVDDGSTDASASVAMRYADAKLRVIRQSNAGVLAARRTGLSRARGDHVVFLDADDRLRPDALARFAAALEREPGTAVVYGDRVLADPAGAVIGSERGALLCPRPSGDVLAQLLRRNFMSTPGQACIRTRAVADADGWRVEIRRMADWYVWCRIAARAPFSFVGAGPVIEYRVRAGSMARSFLPSREQRATIEELLPAIEAVYALPAVRERFAAADLARLRRRTEASAFAWKGQELLRAKRFPESRRYFAQALRRHPAIPDLACFALASIGIVPRGLRRWIGQWEVAGP